MTDVVFRKRFTAWTQGACTFLQAAVREQNVCSDHNVVRLNLFDNPIVSRIEPILHNLERNPWFFWDTHPGIGYQCDPKAISVCHAVNFLFDWAGIRIYEDVQQMEILTFTKILRDVYDFMRFVQ